MAMALSVAQTVLAQDIGARTMGAVSDLLAPIARGDVPAGVDPAVFKQAAEALRKEQLLGSRPPQPVDEKLLAEYGRALLLGNRAGEFASDIGALHDTVLSGETAAIEQSIAALYRKAGRRAPTGDAMAKLVAATREVGGAAPASTQRHVIERPDYTIEITDAEAAGETAVNVALAKGPDGQPARLLLEGATRTRPTADGKGLERRVEPSRSCAMTSAAAAALRPALNGEWTDGDGQTWTISGEGGEVLVVETRPGGHRLDYRGAYGLGRIEASHAIADIADMPSLPAEIAGQLVGTGLSYGLTLQACGAEILKGRWSSQHVTYNDIDYTIKRIHDPYDQPVTLSREAPLPELRFVRVEGGGFRAIEGDLPYDEPIFLEARYAQAPSRPDQTVTVSWDTGSASVPVNATDNPKLYRSAAFVLEPPVGGVGEVRP
jgi:hypothetical protein